MFPRPFGIKFPNVGPARFGFPAFNGLLEAGQPDAAFSFLPFLIYYNNGGTFSIGSWDISAQVSRAGGTYYVTKAGNDITGNGLTEGTAWKTLTKAWTALAAVPNACVKVGVGRYGWSDGGLTATATAITGRSLVPLGDGTVVMDAMFDPGGAWALTGGQTYTFQKNYAVPVVNVLDFGTLDANDDPTPYTLKTSVAEVEALAGSYYQAGGVLYVHSLDEVSPDADVRPQYSGNTTPKVAVNDIDTYWEGIRFYNLIPSFIANAGSNTGKVYFKDCRFMFQPTQPIAITGYTAILQSCQYAHFTASDQITGNAGSGNVAKIAEIDCTGWDAGVSGSGGLNATTNHGAGINVIVNGEYYNTYGSPVGFIGGGKAWILGTNIHDDLSAGDYTLLLQENAWLDQVTLSGNTNDINTDTTVYIKNCNPASPSVIGGGSTSPY